MDIGGPTLVSERRPATQSSTRVAAAAGNVASAAVDGVASGHWGSGSCTATADPAISGPAWWQVDLGSSMAIKHIEVYHRTDCCQDRAVGARVVVSTSADFQFGTACEVLDEAGGAPERVQCNGLQGQYVTVDLSNKPNEMLSVCEVKVYADVAIGDAHFTADSPSVDGLTVLRRVKSRGEIRYSTAIRSVTTPWSQ